MNKSVFVFLNNYFPESRESYDLIFSGVINFSFVLKKHKLKYLKQIYNFRVNTETIKYPPTFVIRAVQFTGLLISKILWRIKFRGLKNIPQDLEGGLIVVANHQTYFDPFWICFKIKRKFRFMAWDKAFSWFLIGRFIRYLGAFPVSLERGGTIKTLKQTLAALRDGATLVIFPEGSRGFSDGEMLEFKTGAARLAIEANVPILPVTVRGANHVWAQNVKFPRFGRQVEIVYHPLLEIARLKEFTDVEEITAHLKSVINSEI